jgi:asparagine synthase (glutamine-hydrolysing)
MARRHVTVALSGTGGDDLFAGYYRHRAPAVARALRGVPAQVLARVARLSPDRGAERRNAVTLARSYAIRLARLADSGATGHEQYLQLVGSSTSPAALEAVLWRPDLAEARRYVGESLGLRGTSLDDLQEFELRSYLPGCILLKEDRATMAHGLEGRVPLLDDEVVALAGRAPVSQRAGMASGKVLLRAVAKRRLPWRQGRKRGFAVPLRALFDGEWHDEAVEWLHDGSSDLLDGPTAAAMVGRSDVPPLEIWGLCALRAWEEELRRAVARGRKSSAAA